jgi:hypothetical protein
VSDKLRLGLLRDPATSVDFFWICRINHQILPQFVSHEAYVFILVLNLELNQSFTIFNNSLMKPTNMHSH